MAKKQKMTNETDSTYFLKLVLYVILGSAWLKFGNPLEIAGILFYGLPVGLLLGLVFASHDHFQVDRKIEYAVLVLTSVVTFFLPTGIFI